MILSFYNANAQVKLPDSILATLNNQHPRLLVTSLADFAAIKKKIPTDEYLVQCQTNVLHEADSILTAPVCWYHIPDGLRLLVMSRNVLNRSYVLSMAYRLSNNKKYADRLYKDLLAASQFPDWNPRHFLDVAEMTHAFAIGYDWLFDVWTKDQKQVIKMAIIEKGLLRGKMFYDNIISPKTTAVHFPTTNSNWNSVCNSGMTVGALAIADEEPLLASFIIKNAVKSIPIALRAYVPDGGFGEGPSYWSYAMKYNVAMMASLESALGSDFGLTKSQGLSVTGNFPIAMNGATGMPYQYADAWPNVVNSPVYFWLANKYSNPLYVDYVKKVSDKSVLDLLWYSNPNTKTELPLDNIFTAVNVASLRSAWNDKNAWFVGIKGGSNQDNHCHLDLGSFIVEKNNIRWFTDLGVDSYDLPGYFDKAKQRWTYYRTRAEGHNTLVINPDTLPDQNLFAKAKITRFVSGNDKSFAVVDLSEAYTKNVTVAQRGIALINKNQVIIQDEIKAEKPFELYWFAHTPANITLSSNNKKATLEIDGKKMVAEIISPANASFQIMKADLLATSIQTDGNNKNKGTKKLGIHLKNVTQTTISVSFKEEGNKAKTIVMPLEKW
ncbi:MAG: heparinase II/III family protein [Pedobacter sp.]|nr:heparinase II/III family protein [Chitinophagaceae bacterium]